MEEIPVTNGVMNKLLLLTAALFAPVLASSQIFVTPLATSCPFVMGFCPISPVAQPGYLITGIGDQTSITVYYSDGSSETIQVVFGAALIYTPKTIASIYLGDQSVSPERSKQVRAPRLRI